MKKFFEILMDYSLPVLIIIVCLMSFIAGYNLGVNDGKASFWDSTQTIFEKHGMQKSTNMPVISYKQCLIKLIHCNKEKID